MTLSLNYYIILLDILYGTMKYEKRISTNIMVINNTYFNE